MHLNQEYYLKYKQQVEDCLERCYTDTNFNLNQLAKELLVSRTTLHRIISTLYNKKTSEYINDFRLEKSISLMSSNNLLIKEVAGMVGFTSVKYFSKVFKQKFGITPTKFKAE